MLINYADITLGAVLLGRSLECPSPNHFEAAITPIFAHEDPRWHYAAAARPLPAGETEDWFEIDLGHERTIEQIEIEWFAEEEVGIEFLLEYKSEACWLEIFHEVQGDKVVRRGLYKRKLPSPVTARHFKFKLRKSSGQNRLLIRQFRLLGKGELPPTVLMLAPDDSVIDRRILQEARSLIQAGYKVILICGLACSQEEHYIQDAAVVHRYKYDWSVPWDQFVIDRLRQFPADVVHVHDLPLLPHGARIAAEWGVPLVFDAHEIYYESPSLSSYQQQMLVRQERCYLPRVNLFITVNEFIADYYEQIYGIRPLSLMNCADSYKGSLGMHNGIKLRELAQLPADSRIVLYQGWISEERNLATLVQAAEYFPEDTYLVLIGYGEYEKELRMLIENKPWRHKVRFFGQVMPESLLALTAGADLGVIPYQPIDLNHEFCSPNKFFEYIQAGVPVIAHKLPFFQYMAATYKVVALADLSNATRMAQAITSLLEDQGQLNQMRKACQEAAQKLNWETESRKLVYAYQRLMEEYQANRIAAFKVPYREVALKQIMDQQRQLMLSLDAHQRELQQQKEYWANWQREWTAYQQESALRWTDQDQRLRALENMRWVRFVRWGSKIYTALMRRLTRRIGSI